MEAQEVGSTLRVGIDLVDVTDVREALAAHGDRYLHRVYTDGEVNDCRSPAGEVSPQLLAARFAAKEAVIKVLQPESTRVPWRSIEVRATGDTAPTVGLRGVAGRRAAECGVGQLALSLTHGRRHAMALALGRVTEAPDR